VVSRAFYEGLLETQVATRELLPFAVIVLHQQSNCICSHCAESRTNSGGGNHHEARLVSALGAAMQLHGHDNTILTYYAAQKRHVQSISGKKENIHTIDSVQGREFPCSYIHWQVIWRWIFWRQTKGQRWLVTWYAFRIRCDHC